MALTGKETIEYEVVGLSRKRPFRFCTFHWGRMRESAWVQPGDDPQHAYVSPYPGHRAVLIDTPLNEITSHIQPHAHEFHELAIIQQGSAVHIESGGEYTVGRGDVVVLAPGGVHGFRGIDEMTKTNIYVQPEWLSEELRLLWDEPGLFRFLLGSILFPKALHERVWHLKLSEPELCACERELDDLHTEARKARPSLALFTACFLKILWLLNGCCLRTGPPGAGAPRDEVWYAAERIETLARTGTRLNARDLAAEVGMSRSGLARVFKEATGMAPMDYFQHRRVCHSTRFLAGPSASMTDIAHRLGYSDSAHFSRLFKRAMGCTPTEYRRRHHAAPQPG